MRKLINSVYFFPAINAVMILMAFVILPSCHSTRKQLNKAANTFDAHIKERDKFCAERYKPIEKTTTQIKYKQGKTVLKREHDTQYVSVDCPPSPKATTKTVKVYVPIQVDTLAIETMVERESVAALAVKDNEISVLRCANSKLDTMLQNVSKEAISCRGKYKTAQYKFYGLIGLIVAYVGYRGYRWYKKGFKVWA